MLTKYAVFALTLPFIAVINMSPAATVTEKEVSEKAFKLSLPAPVICVFLTKTKESFVASSAVGVYLNIPI